MNLKPQNLNLAQIGMTKEKMDSRASHREYKNGEYDSDMVMELSSA